MTAFNTVIVKSRVDGQIVRIAFREGQKVAAGDLLVEIDRGELHAHQVALLDGIFLVGFAGGFLLDALAIGFQCLLFLGDVGSLPIGLLLALLFSLSRMSRTNEIISMLTAGRSVFRLLLPLLFVGVLALTAAQMAVRALG